MRLYPPAVAPVLHLVDINDHPVDVGATGRPMLLSFFRDATCPFCNFRVYELTTHYQSLAALGLDVVAVFAASPDAVRRFVVREPRPFPVVADTSGEAYAAYAIEHSLWRKPVAAFTRMPTLMKGLKMVGMAGLRTNNVLPADFLIDADGKLLAAHYGRDAGDHLSFANIEHFLARGNDGHAAPAS